MESNVLWIPHSQYIYSWWPGDEKIYWLIDVVFDSWKYIITQPRVVEEYGTKSINDDSKKTNS